MQNVREMARTVGRATRTGANSVVNVVKNDPIPFALAGLGVAWVVTQKARSRAKAKSNGVNHGFDEATMATAGEDMGPRTRRGMNGHARSRMLREKAHAAVDSLVDTLDFADEATDDIAGETASTGRKVANVVTSKPFMAAAGVAALGALAYAGYRVNANRR
ncbi:MAG TPA: hypothetical protein VE967_06545 [Gemmatimonadaceae bacterium]|nr:hypothetical protein [Gemmatimonadaceae bacterium]